ncbi:MAG: P1 family peptidase [Candidatus Levybacteria bacterium]|nr:P1 family peptidase [Candidatus Levybacteria bacterium]
MNKTLTALKGVKVGHSTHLDKLTGCTLVMFDDWYPTAYKSYGGAPGTFNTEILKSGMSFYRSNGIFIAGGSLTGLMSASEIMQAMIENKIGSPDGKIINPVIRGAIVFDLGVDLGQNFDPKFGREAFENLSVDPVANGNVGAGTGTAVGKFQYLEMGKKNGGMKSGVGSARIDLGGGSMICALSVVNALGNVVKEDGTILAGNRDEKKKFKVFDETSEFVTSKTNTTINIVGMNIDLKTRENYERVAHMATHGQIRAINPVHTSVDGDTVFVFSTEENKNLLNKNGKSWETPGWPLFSVDVVGNAAAKAVQESIYNACLSAETIKFEQGYKGVIPSCKDYE